MRLLVIWIALSCIACGTTRKLSDIDVRKLASSDTDAADANLEISLARAKLAQPERSACNDNFLGLLRSLSQQKIEPPRCPRDFISQVQLSTTMLQLEERSSLEELINVQCQNLVRSQQDQFLENFIANFETDGPIGRRKAIVETVRSQEEEYKILNRLKETAQEVLFNLPFEHWVNRHGIFMIPEEYLPYFSKLIQSKDCRVQVDEMEKSYQILQSLEDLNRLLWDEKQKQDARSFIEELWRVDDRVMDFFYPNGKKEAEKIDKQLENEVRSEE